jgi:hypothetical protein
VTAFSSDGSTWLCVCGPDELLLLELDELLLDELLLPPGIWISHGGTTSFWIELFSGITSWFCEGGTVPCGVVPPGDIRIVLIACWDGAWLELELELDELDELLLELDELPEVCCAGHGGTATVWASVPLGTTIVVDPAGGLAVGLVLPTPPDGCPVLFCSEPPVGQGGIAISMSLRCLARTTVRVPGVWSAVAIGSVDDELLLELELPPQAPSAAARATSRAKPRPVRATEWILPAITPPCRLRCQGVPTQARAVRKHRAGLG